METEREEIKIYVVIDIQLTRSIPSGMREIDAGTDEEVEDLDARV